MKLLKIIFLFSGILTFLIIISTYTLFYLTSNSLPKYQQKLKSSQINNVTTISRDTYGIPYITTTDDLDSFYALGYAHAQDRLWQMMLLRRTAQGRLSEIIGLDGLKSDKLMRTLGIYASAQSSEKIQTANISTILNSYSNGINFYIKQISEKSLGRGSPESFIFTSEVSPWRPADSLAILKLIAFQSTNKAKVEILRTQALLTQLKPERYDDLFSEPPLISHVKNQTISYLRKQKFQPKDIFLNSFSKENSINHSQTYLSENSLGASNIFAVMPYRSATGAVLAASDPHAALTTPSNFMLVNVKLSGDAVIGATVPGIPAILIGRKKTIGWGISNASIDDQDLYIEKLNPENSMEYFTEKGLTKFKIKKEIIKIKNKKSITFEVKNTNNGPIIPPELLEIGLIRPKGHEISMNWTGLSNNDRSLESLISLMKSQTINQAKKNLPLLRAPGQNFIIVDKNNIELITAGAIPKRNISHSTGGKIPSLGWIDKNAWIGTIPFDMNPKMKNPKSGIVINTNNRTTDAAFPFHVSYDWGDSQRIIRASNLLNKRQFHTVSSFQEIQNDTVSISARILLPLLAKNLWFSQQSDHNEQLEDSEEEALIALSEWNGDMNQNNSEPLIFVSWLREFQRMVMIDDLGSLYSKFSNIRPLFLERILRNKNGAAEWCDISQTSEIETCDQIAKRSLRISIKKLQKKFGFIQEDWRWGDPHLAIHKSQIIGSWPILSFFTNIVHEISGGDNTMMMSKMANVNPDQFVANFGSTLRTIYDFSNDDHSLFIISTGQSGHFLSPHYDDQSLLWQKEEYIPIRYDITNRNGGSIATTTLTPKQNK